MRRFPFIISLALAALAISPARSAQPATPPAPSGSHSHNHSHGHGHAKMSPERKAQAELGAQAAINADGIVWAVHKTGGRIAVSRSENRGKSWDPPVFVTDHPEETDSGGDARPKIALGPKSEIYLTWTRPLQAPFAGEIRFSRSLDGGKTFSPSRVVHQDRQEITHRFDAITVNDRGQIFVAWIDKRDLVAAAAAKMGGYRGAALYFAVSDDQGASFRGDYKVADHSCECCRVALHCHRDGSVSAIWRHIFEPNTRDHAVARLRPDGTSGPFRRASFDDWNLDACPHHGPGLTEDAEGHLHAVWFTGAEKNPGVFYGRLAEGRVDGIRAVGTKSAARADIRFTGTKLVVAWKEFDGEQTRLRAMTSPDGGTDWKEFTLDATAGASDHPQVISRDGKAYVFWNTRDKPLLVTAIPD